MREGYDDIKSRIVNEIERLRDGKVGRIIAVQRYTDGLFEQLDKFVDEENPRGSEEVLVLRQTFAREVELLKRRNARYEGCDRICTVSEISSRKGVFLDDCYMKNLRNIEKEVLRTVIKPVYSEETGKMRDRLLYLEKILFSYDKQFDWVAGNIKADIREKLRLLDRSVMEEIVFLKNEILDVMSQFDVRMDQMEFDRIRSRLNKLGSRN